MDEAALVTASQAGDRKAFGGLVDMYYKDVYKVVYSYAGCHELASDVSQETFLGAIENIHKLRKSGSFKVWILKIAMNMMHRKFRKKKSGNIVASIDESKDCFEYTDQTESMPDIRLSSEEEAKVIRAELDRMPEVMRMATVLILMEGLTQKQAASIIGCSEATVSRNIEWAKNWLSNRLSKLM